MFGNFEDLGLGNIRTEDTDLVMLCLEIYFPLKEQNLCNINNTYNVILNCHFNVKLVPRGKNWWQLKKFQNVFQLFSYDPISYSYLITII